VRKLARAHGMSAKTIHTKLYKDPNLSKKLARWGLKLINDDMKKELVRIVRNFREGSPPLDMLDNIAPLGESAVSLHKPETK
jgi:hypothetical protein